MKLKKTATAVALTALLALGAAPVAFAADGNTNADTSADSNIQGDGTGDTTVMVETVATNISVTVPLQIKVVGPAEGGALSGVPTNYNIVNNSVYPIKVASVIATADEAGNWGISETALTDQSESTAKIGDINLTLQMTGAAAPLTVKTTSQDLTDWIVDAKTADAGTTKNIAVAGSLSQIKSVKDAATTAVKVQYTIAATSVAEPAPAPDPDPVA
ncbi:hypothetical protein [Raoultibacter phocaeensis]|uniref:hypothetical protein n=1 Tax=Raoultibacter phocaeensis TaxID=2479841 RepID=UPI00111A694C|nr:hypothetical protein [Raoultibacter phocaeensis]